MPSPVDKLGRPIEVGAYIAYGHALGRCAGLRIGKVLAVKPVERTWARGPQWHFTVIGVNDDWRAPSLNSRKGTLQFGERILVLPDVPAPFKALLDGYGG